MKKVFVLFTLFICSSLTAQVKIWKQTTSTDYSAGTFDRVISTTVSDGELQLIHPLVQTGKDTLDASIPLFVSYDDAENYLQGWISSNKVYVQKFNNQRQPISNVINVDENARADGSTVGVALLNDGRFVVCWAESFDSTGGLTYTPRYCQFFNASNAKVGNNFRIFNLGNGTRNIPGPIADQINQRFLIIGTEGNSTTGFQSYAWLYNPPGVKLRDSIKIVPSSVTKNEYHIKGVFRNGKFAFVWSGGDGNSGPYDVYFLLADSNSIPLMSPVIANDIALKGDFPIAAFDDAGNCNVIWSWTPGSVPGPPGKLYGQVFDSTERKIGISLQLTNLQSGGINQQDISSVNGIFRITYIQRFTNGLPDQKWVSYWKIMSILSGNFISRIFDAGSQQTNYQQISWNETTPPGTRLKFQLRSSTTKEDIQSVPWIGPLSISDYYTNASGETFNAATNMKRYLQVKAFFETDTNGTTPVLNDISVSYLSADTVAPVPVSNVVVHGEHRRIIIEWDKSVSADVKTYRIYRTIGVKNFAPEPFIELPPETVSYIDSSVTYDTTYRYGITSVDSTFNESAIVQTGQISPKIMKIFVTPSGSASGDGTSLKPFSKITDGINFSFHGDSIYVLPGEYTEDIVMKEGISLIGSGASMTKVISSNSGSAVMTAPNTIVQGFTFLVARGIVGGGDNVTVTENILIHQGSGFDAGIVPGKFEHVVISKNILMNFSTGIQTVSMPNPPLTPIMIRNNIIYGQMGVENRGSNINIVNNTFIVVGESGVGISISTGPTLIMNNCFTGYSSEVGWSVSKPKLATVSFEYNNQWNLNGNQIDPVSSTNISVDPLFISTAKNNFHLKSGSFCINAGSPSPEYNDKDGSRNDIGAYGGPDPLPEYMTLALATELSLSGGTGFPGDTISIDVTLSTAVGVQKIDIEIQFDGNIATFLDAATAPLTKDFFITVHGGQTGKCTIHLEGTSEIPSGSGTIATLRFRLEPSVSSGLCSAVEISGVELLDGGNNRITLSSVSSGLIVIKSSVSFPHRIYVDGSYSGISNGTILYPYITIQQGISNAKEGDTVFIAAGTYIGPITMRSNVYVKGSGAAATAITYPYDPLNSTPVVVRINNVQNTGIYGCAIINYSFGSAFEVISSSNVDIALNKIDQSGSASYSVMVSSGSHVTIRDNYFIESKYGADIMINIGSDDAIITRNTFSPSFATGVIMLNASARATITNNKFDLSGESMTGISGLKPKQTIIANNLFVGKASAGFGMKFVSAESTYVLNNIFDELRTGVDENSGSYILNNVFLSSTVGVSVASPTVHRYNLFNKNSLNVNNGNLDATEISGDPQFIDQEKENYRPVALSIMRNAGDPAMQWNDKDGTRNDIGIYGGPYADTTMFVSSNIRLRIGNSSGTPGDTVKIPIIASGIIGMSGMQLLIEYDSQRLQLLNIHTTAATSSFSMVQKNIGQSIVTVEMNGSESVVIDSAAIAELTMLVQPQATGSAFVNFQNVCVMSGAAQMISVQYTENGIVDLTPTSVGGKDAPIPRVFSLAQNYPNPFNPMTTIEFSIPFKNYTTLKIYDILGREVNTIISQVLESGIHSFNWNAKGNSSGVYFYRLQSGNMVATKKLLLLK